MIRIDGCPGVTWPITEAAREAYAAEEVRLAADSVRLASRAVAGARLQGPARSWAEERLRVVRDLLAMASVVESPEVAAIGRRVTIQEIDGGEWSCWIVAPGDGDARHGWVSATAPLGAALLGRRPGDRARVEAPAGAWELEVVRVEEPTMLDGCQSAPGAPPDRANSTVNRRP